MVWILGILTVAFTMVIITLVTILLWEMNIKPKAPNSIVAAETKANLEYLEREQGKLIVIK